MSFAPKLFIEYSPVDVHFKTHRDLIVKVPAGFCDVLLLLGRAFVFLSRTHTEMNLRRKGREIKTSAAKGSCFVFLNCQGASPRPKKEDGGKEKDSKSVFLLSLNPNPPHGNISDSSALQRIPFSSGCCEVEMKRHRQGAGVATDWQRGFCGGEGFPGRIVMEVSLLKLTPSRRERKDGATG